MNLVTLDTPTKIVIVLIFTMAVFGIGAIASLIQEHFDKKGD